MSAREILGDVVGLVGAGLILLALWDVWQPLALVSAGAVLLRLSWVMSGGPLVPRG
jgi:hypothetical protein